ncbi:MAG TPA: TRAP transporter small permease subunit [Vicinamibacteria bacterium]|nr:TRAP transporter small permease subunit [Vicinamibacteria bacterium]
MDAAASTSVEGTARGGIGFEGLLVLAVLAAAALLPLAEALGRLAGGYLIPGAAEWMRLLLLWMTFLAGLYAAGAGRHLTLSTAELLGQGRLRRFGRWLAGTLSAATAGVLAWAASGLVQVTREEAKSLPGGRVEDVRPKSASPGW